MRARLKRSSKDQESFRSRKAAEGVLDTRAGKRELASSRALDSQLRSFSYHSSPRLHVSALIQEQDSLLPGLRARARAIAGSSSYAVQARAAGGFFDR